MSATSEAPAATAAGDTSSANLSVPSAASEWIQLTDEKDFSRLLYTNPVCFLSSTSFCQEGAEIGESSTAEAVPRRNVMVLSWLTATNNAGRFMFSLNRDRHSATMLVPKGGAEEPQTGIEFVLSVPVKGMEQLVLDVGGTSGKWGSKFTDDHSSGNDGDDNDHNVEIEKMQTGSQHVHASNLSNRQKKKLKRQQLAKGIPSLVAVPLGHSVTLESATKNGCFAVHGTCAHLRCRTYHIVGEPEDIIDKDHYLVLAEVSSAFVHRSYWDSRKKQFRPMTKKAMPYLTFFGAQQFGYIHY